MTAQAARKAPRPVRAADEPDDGIIRIGDEPEEPVYDTLFRLGGTSYKVLTNPPASLMLDYFDRMRKDGTNVAFSWVLEEMVGEEAYGLLLHDARVSRENFRAIATAVMRIVLGNTDDDSVPKSSRGSRSNGRRPSASG
jgi:hypothetical protein